MLLRARAQLRYIIDGTEEAVKREAIANADYLKNHSPKVWNVNVEGNREVAYETSFNQLLISVCSELYLDSNKITTFEFYNAVSLLERRNKND